MATTSPIKVTARDEMARGRFLSLNQLNWIDAKGITRKWEAVERLGDFRAVMIIPRLVPSGRMVLIKQYRPPAGGWVVEFPAGILNPDEEPSSGAARELREETGFIARDILVFPPSFTSPGMSNESIFTAVVNIDETLPENIHRHTEFDPGEMIETILVTDSELDVFYRKQAVEGVRFDSKLVTYIIALGCVAGNDKS